MFFAILASEEYFYEDISKGKEKNEEDIKTMVLRSIVSISTIILLFFIYNHYRLLLQFLKCKEWIDGNKNLRTSGYWKWMFFELLL
mmetsp:Transcript_28386/g.25112  ORF Transcript_28386/g.25112 Transcript_28386/m.25112 type:complete len:86 (-) Transcript_28386:976-1233(-)